MVVVAMRGEVLWAMERRCRASDAGAALDEFPVVAVGMRGEGLWAAARRCRARGGSAGRRAVVGHSNLSLQNGQP